MSPSDFVSNMGFPFSIAGLSLLGVIAFWVLTAIVHITFAVAVYRDASRLESPVFVGAGIWLIATLIGGVFTAAIYWAIHRSRLNPSNHGSSAEADKDEIL